jgi:hypothetical protein
MDPKSGLNDICNVWNLLQVLRLFLKSTSIPMIDKFNEYPVPDLCHQAAAMRAEKIQKEANKN